MDDPSAVSVKRIKVGRTTQARRCGGVVVVPFIRLSGRWLEQAGFVEGDMMQVTATDGELRLVRSVDRNPACAIQGELF